MTFLLLVFETLLAPFAALGVVVSFALSPRRRLLADLASELPERFGGLSTEARARLAGKRIWWLHAASAGEVGGLAPLIAALAARPDAPAIFVTTMTAAGRAAARRNPQIAWAQLAPLDTWPCVSRLIKNLRADRLLLSETELWPSLILLSASAGLRPTLINARLTRRSVARYRPISFFLRPILRALDAILAQSELDAERFREIGALDPKLSVVGNTKYDRPAAPAHDVAAALAKLAWTENPLFVAGSTHPGEEDQILDAFARCAEATPSLRLVIAPRHVERARDLMRGMKTRNLGAVRWSELTGRPPMDVKILVLDEIGALTSFWPKAAASFVGGTLVPVGGHNVLEPAQVGVPVIFGPHTDHVEYPALLLENGGGGFRVADAEALAAALDALVKDPDRARGIGAKARELAGRLCGATERTIAALENQGLLAFRGRGPKTTIGKMIK